MNKLIVSKSLLVTAIVGAVGSANAAASDVATELTGIITTYGGALTAVVVAGVVIRFTWKWIRSVR